MRVQFGVEASVTFMNTKQALDGRNFCFVSCKNQKDEDYLLEEMHDSMIGDWDEPIVVKVKKDHNS